MNHQIGIKMIKKVANCLYAHSSNVEELLINIPDNLKNDLKNFLTDNIYSFNDINNIVIKVNTYKKTFSIIKTKDWDFKFEPIIIYSATFNHNGQLMYERNYKKNYPIYHKKYMFVAEDYNGFNIKECKDRVDYYESIIPNFNSIKNKIGYLDFWSDLLKQYNIVL